MMLGKQLKKFANDTVMIFILLKLNYGLENSTLIFKLLLYLLMIAKDSGMEDCELFWTSQKKHARKKLENHWSRSLIKF